MELICIIAVCGVVLVLILIGIMYKLACAKKSSECEVYDDEEEDDEDADEKEKLEVWWSPFCKKNTNHTSPYYTEDLVVFYIKIIFL